MTEFTEIPLIYSSWAFWVDSFFRLPSTKVFRGDGLSIRSYLPTPRFPIGSILLYGSFVILRGEPPNLEDSSSAAICGNVKIPPADALELIVRAESNVELPPYCSVTDVKPLYLVLLAELYQSYWLLPAKNALEFIHLLLSATFL